jgi:hypothetical protein
LSARIFSIVRSPVALDAGNIGRRERQSRLRQSVEIAGHKTVRCESDDPVMRKIERLDIVFVGRLAEIERLGRIGVERIRNRDQLVARVGQPRQQQLGRSALEVQRTIGIADEAPLSASILSSLGNILVLQRKMKEASEIYAQLDKAMAQWPPQQREVFELNGSRIAALYASGQVEAGIAAATTLVKIQLDIRCSLFISF